MGAQVASTPATYPSADHHGTAALEPYLLGFRDVHYRSRPSPNAHRVVTGTDAFTLPPPYAHILNREPLRQ
eukprot:gene9218-8295_t